MSFHDGAVHDGGVIKIFSKTDKEKEAMEGENLQNKANAAVSGMMNKVRSLLSLISVSF